MVAQERPPALARGRRRSPPTVPLDRGLADRDPELLEFTADPFGTPPRVVPRHRRDQGPDLRADARTADPRARPPAPEQAPSPAVPAQDRLRCDHDEVPAPVAASEADQEPEQLVAGAWPRALPGRARQDRELLAQEEVLGDQFAAAAEGRPEQADEQEQVLDHRRP